MSKSTALLDPRRMEEAAQQACVYSAGMDREACLADRKTRHAVLFTLLLIGEAAARLLAKRPDFTGRFDDIPWRAMKGMRNRIVHAYQDLDHDTVWTTVNQEPVVSSMPCLRLPASLRWRTSRIAPAGDVLPVRMIWIERSAASAPVPSARGRADNGRRGCRRAWLRRWGRRECRRRDRGVPWCAHRPPGHRHRSSAARSEWRRSA